METFGKFMTVLLSMIISPIINGFVFSKLWLWFIVPVFHTNPVRIVEAIGILVLINFIRLKGNTDFNNDNFWEKYIKSLILMIFVAAFALLFGWVVTLFL